MLNQRDKELARRIAFEVRHGPDASFPESLPGEAAVPLMIILGVISVALYRYDFHGLFWGTAAFLALLMPALHASWRYELRGSRSADIFWLSVYFTIFWCVRQFLQHNEYDFASLMNYLLWFVGCAPLFYSLFRSRW